MDGVRCSKCGGIGFVWPENSAGAIEVCDCGLIANRARLDMNIPRHYRGARLDQFPVFLTKEYRLCKRFVEEYDCNKAGVSQGLVMVGMGRSGKTHAACAVMNAFFDRMTRDGMSYDSKIARYWNMGDLAERLKDAAREGWGRDLLTEVNRAELLVLDDLAAPTYTEFVTGQLYLIIERRLNTGKGLIITVDADPKTIRSANEAAWMRTYNRIREIVGGGSAILFPEHHAMQEIQMVTA